MSSWPSHATEAVVICTRNRPEELARTLQGIEKHSWRANLAITIVDASDPEEKEAISELLEPLSSVPIFHWPYGASPSLARQRNFALRRLPTSVEVVHFIDDDVTVQEGYFDHLSQTLRTQEEIGGVGGLISEPGKPPAASFQRLLQTFFFLSHPEPGRVLRSGCTSSAQHTSLSRPPESLRATEWLSGCSSSYRRSVLQTHRFDPALSGYSMLEDLDLSYRVGQEARLVVQPKAQLVHRRSARNRLDSQRYSCALTIHRRWFIEKHFKDPLSRGAYWWSLLGRALAILTSSKQNRTAAFKGLLRGIKAVWKNEHPLLKPSTSQ